MGCNDLLKFAHSILYNTTTLWITRLIGYPKYTSLVTVIGFCLSCCLQQALAENQMPPQAINTESMVGFIETDESNCLVNEGKMISLKLNDSSGSVEVWVDRWYMSVQTADHTKQILTPKQSIAELGCSRTYAGPQHWTIYSVKRISTP